MINLELPEQLQQVKEMTHSFALSLLRPISRKYDIAEHEYPKELDALRGVVGGGSKDKKKEAGDKKKDKKSSSPKLDNMIGVISGEETAWGDIGLVLTIPGRGLGNAAIAANGTEEQKKKFGVKWAAMAITEPEAGSDAFSINTTADLDGDQWVLNGEKIFVTCADRCEIVVVWATVDASAGRAGIKSFIVEKGTPGFKLEYLEHKLGIRASDTGTFVLKDCRIPKENILGSAEVKKEGYKGVGKTFDNTRPSVASLALGAARASLELTKEKMEESGAKVDYYENANNISSNEKEYYMMEANLEVSRLLTWRAACMADTGERNSLEAAMCKAKTCKAGTQITQKCCDILGPLGFTQDHLAEKWMRDVKITDIFEGTGQIMHRNIARQILGVKVD